MNDQVDFLHRFRFTDFPVRGAVIRLKQSWLQLQQKNQTNESVQLIFGQAAAATGLMFNSIKFNGRISIQLQGDSPISLMLVQSTSQGEMRGIVRSDQKTEGDFKSLTRGSTLAITLERDELDHRQQGIVPMEGNTLADALCSYFERSEQINSWMVLASDSQHAAGLLLQAMPDSGGKHQNFDPDGWNRSKQLAATVSEEELLTLTPSALLHRLYHRENIQMMNGMSMRFACTCSRQRVMNMLLGLGKKEAIEAVDVQGLIKIDCEFCNQDYQFDRVDLEQLFVTQRIDQASSQKQ